MTPASSARGRVLLVANYESDVGYAWWLMEHFWHLIATAMQAQGRSCLLAYPQIRSVPEVIKRSPIELIEFPFTYQSAGDIRRGLDLIRRHRIESLYLTDWPYLHWVYALWRLTGVKRIVIHDHTPGDRPPLRGVQALVKDALHAPGIASATGYVGVSSYIGRRLQENARVPARRCTVVTNGIPTDDRPRSAREEVRKRLDIPQDAVLIVLVSRATYYKGIDFAVRSLARVLQQDENRRRRVFAVHCGDGPDVGAFEQLARELNISENFRFLGRRQDVRDILGAADIAFHASHGEAMSLAILEFMAAELAVLTSDLPSVSAALQPGITGLTYRHGDEAHAADTLQRLIDDPSLRKSLGAAAAAACRTNFSLDAMNHRFSEQVLPLL
jgi:glycosyltransferase involved in cell wall biosynthesis